MANYNIDIGVVIKGNEKLTRFNERLKGTSLEVKQLNKFLKEFSQSGNGLVRSFNSLNQTLSNAKVNFNAVASGTKLQEKAARQLIIAQKELNAELKQRETLLQRLSTAPLPLPGTGRGRDRSPESFRIRNMKGKRSSLVPGESLFGQSVTVEGGASGRARQMIAERQVVQEALAKMDQRDRMKAREKHLKNIDKKVAKIATIQTQQQSQRAFAGLPGGFGVPGGQIGPALPRGFRIKQQFKQGGMFGMPGGAMGRLRGGAGSAMIGGGFPLLFGAGGLSSIMGGIAGGLGGALAPGGGFAASIAATAAAAQIEKVRAFRKEVRNLNNDLSSMGISSEFSRKQIKDLAKEFDITNEEAVKLAATFKTFGADQAGTLLSAFGSREIFDSLSGLRDTESVLGKIKELSGNISEEKRRELLQTIANKGPLEAQLELQKEIIAIKRRAATDKKIKDFDFDDVFKNSRGKYKQAYDTEKEREEYKLKKQKEFNEEFNETNLTAEELLENQIKINEQMQFLAEFRAPTDELREMLNPMRQILDVSVAIRDGFKDSFRGIIDGTMSVGDAFRNMFMRIADHFMDMAAQMAAVQIQKGFLSLFSNMFNFNFKSPGNDVQNTVMTAANGGPVGMRQPYLVGERGPELFVPNQSGNIIPNHDLAGIGGGSTNIVVNVDASGSSVEGDNSKANEFGEQLAAAIQAEIINQKRSGGLLN